jgi:chorismate--pyruvate lyase
MSNVSIEADRTRRWRWPETWTEDRRPGALWPWLTEAGSLTARLRAHCDGEFRVHVLASGAAALGPAEAAWTGRREAFVREAHLCCGATAWIYARTLAVDGGADATRLRALGDNPLGDGAFARASTWRGRLEIAGPDSACPCWRRRSILHIGEETLYISEQFLGGATPWQ